ncbi:MAG: glycoside hydrolase family 88 protein [Prevotella sp.]|nr:glycoside hydrolase family 88 protein [Prevotella sp.]
MKRLSLLLLVFTTATLAQAALTPGHYYRLTQSGKSAFPINAGIANNTAVVLWDETSVAAQRWLLIDAGEGKYQLKNAYTGLFLNYTGANVNQRTESASKTTGAWVFEPVEGKEDTYSIYNYTRRYKLSVAEVENEVQLRVMSLSSATNAEWEVVEDDDFRKTFDSSTRDDIMDDFMAYYYKRASTGYVLGNGGWWGDAEMFETILDAFETTGNKKYQTYFQQLYNNFNARNRTDWSYNAYNDDITWMVLACIRAYQYFGTNDYLTKAKSNFDRMYARAKQQFGTLIWCQDQSNKLGTNSCINCPATIAACYLAQMTGDDSYYEKALDIYAAQRRLLFVPSTGQVYDSRAWNEDGTMSGDFNSWASTYNQGTMLGAAVLLYNYTKDPMYKQDAERIHNYTISHLTNSNNFVHVCQTISGDLCGFKGIYMRYARRYAQEMNHPEVLDWMASNAWHAYQNRNSKGIIWSAWLTKTNESLQRMEGTTQKTTEPFSASTAVSVAFNAHVNGLFTKNAFETTEVRYFDDVRRFQLDNTLSDGETPHTTASAASSYLGFHNVEFGDRKASKLVLRANASNDHSQVYVYLDSIAEGQLIGTSEMLPQEWDYSEITLDKEISGRHSIYFTFSGSGMRLHSFIFADGTADVRLPGSTPAETADRRTYNLQGTLMKDDGTQLPAGIYIRGGKKFIVR